jgi:hypothetical protein
MLSIFKIYHCTIHTELQTMSERASQSNPFSVSENIGEGSALIKMINSEEQWESCECGRLLTETDVETLSDQSADSSKVIILLLYAV